MKERLITLISALAALVTVIVLLSPPPQPPATEVSLPTSVNSGRFGLLGLKRWLDASHIPNFSLQTRYTELFGHSSVAATGNLLIVSAPATVPARAQELEALLFWISQGNDLLLLRADSDAPPWAMAAPDAEDSDVLNQLGFQLLEQSSGQAQDDTEEDAEDEPPVPLSQTLRQLGDQLDEFQYQEATLTPLAHHPLSKDVNLIGARRLPAAQTPTQLLGLDWPRHSMVILRDADGQAAMWETRVGQGRLWVSRFADLFGNVTLGRNDNARFLANLINHSLQPDGQVIFDDMHFGVSSLYDPEAFFGDSRLHNTLWFILGFWLLYVVGYGNRFAPPRQRAPEVQSVDFVYAVGGYFARRLTLQSAAMALFKHFFNDVRAHYQQPLNGEPVWDLLQRNPRVSPITLARLQSLYQALDSRPRINLITLRNQLLSVRKQIIL